ncbi:MAG: hypothetical protein ABJA18_01755 [bacterium]
MGLLLLLLDARVDPVSPVPWGALMLLLVIVFVLAVGFVAGLVVLLIWLKRRKAKQAAVSS